MHPYTLSFKKIQIAFPWLKKSIGGENEFGMKQKYETRISELEEDILELEELHRI